MSTPVNDEGAEREPSDGEVNWSSSVIERMKDVSKCTSDAQLAKTFNISRSNISKWRKRKNVPYEQIQRVSTLCNVDIIYILTGQTQNGQFSTVKSIDVDTLKLVLRALYFPTMLVLPPGRHDVDDYIDRLAKSISRRYNDIENAVADIVKATGLDEPRARGVARKAASSILSGTVDDTEG